MANPIEALKSLPPPIRFGIIGVGAAGAYVFVKKWKAAKTQSSNPNGPNTLTYAGNSPIPGYNNSGQGGGIGGALSGGGADKQTIAELQKQIADAAAKNAMQKTAPKQLNAYAGTPAMAGGKMVTVPNLPVMSNSLTGDWVGDVPFFQGTPLSVVASNPDQTQELAYQASRAIPPALGPNGVIVNPDVTVGKVANPGYDPKFAYGG